MASLQERRGTGADINLRSGPQMLEYVGLADRLRDDQPGRILDWGCGFGQVTVLLRERGLDVEPFDYREEADGVQVVALERYPEVRATISSDPVKLPYEDDQFDAVLSCGVLEHVVDPDASLDELRRVLRPGGRLYVFKLPNAASYLEKIAKVAGLYYHGAYPDDRLYTPRTARRLLERHGYVVEELRFANMLPL